MRTGTSDTTSNPIASRATIGKAADDYLEAGDSLDEFLESFPSVSRKQAIAALELAREMTEAHAAPAR